MMLEVGRLSRTDIIKVIRDSEEPHLREQFANWLMLLDAKELDHVEEPHKLVLVLTDSPLLFEELEQ